MEINKIAEKDKVEVLMKYLKGFPKESINNYVNIKTITEAFKTLIKTFGNPVAM